MKFSELGRIALASAASVALALGIAACGQSNTIDYVFVTSSKNNPGNVFVFRADGQSGALTRLNTIFSSGGRNPVAEVVSPNSKYLYVVYHDDATVVQFAIGTDGKIAGWRASTMVESWLLIHSSQSVHHEPGCSFALAIHASTFAPLGLAPVQY